MYASLLVLGLVIFRLVSSDPITWLTCFFLFSFCFVVLDLFLFCVCVFFWFVVDFIV